jgi:AcrR family transcriptional regulator
MEKTKILSGAFTVWQKSMFTRTSLTPLARELGVSKAAIYRYFPGKDSIIDTMEEYFARKYSEKSVRMLEILKVKDIKEGIEGYTRELIGFLSGNPGFIRFFISRLYHQYQRETLPFWPILKEEALHLQARFTAAGFDKDESALCVRYFYTHVLSWAHLLTVKGLNEAEVSGYVPVIVTSFFEGFAPPGLPEVPYETVEKEVRVLPGALPEENRIISSLLAVAAKNGIEGASISRIAEEAGYSKSTLYSYFRNKNSMILSILKDHTEAVDRLYACYCTGEYPVNEAIYRLILLISRYLCQTPSFLLTLNWLRFQSPKSGKGGMEGLRDRLPRFVQVMKNRECRSFGLAPERLMAILWFQLIREIMDLYGEAAPGSAPQEKTSPLRTLQVLFCEGLEGIERRHP